MSEILNKLKNLIVGYLIVKIVTECKPKYEQRKFKMSMWKDKDTKYFNLLVWVGAAVTH